MAADRREHASPTRDRRNTVQVNGSARLVVHTVSCALPALFRWGLLLLRSTSLLTDPLPQGGEPLAGGTGFGMVRPKRLFADGKRALVEGERLGFGISALLGVEASQVGERVGHIRMLRAHPLLPDVQGPPVEWLGLLILALFGVEVRQVTERDGYQRMVRT